MSFTNFPNGITSFGVPVFGGGGMGPIFGKTYFVDGTNGSDDNPGTFETPKATIQAAVTLQIANSSGLGDVIYIMPGTYAESIYAPTLNDVSLIGTSADSVIIAPTAGHGLLVGLEGVASLKMTRSLIKNITFLTATGTNTTWAALGIAYVTDSTIEDCRFLGTTTTGYNASATIGLQIGNRTDTPWEFSERLTVRRCRFGTQGSRLQELGIGLHVGSFVTANPSYRGFALNLIEDNIFGCYDTGIKMQTGSVSCGGTVIRRNVITGHQGGVGGNIGIRSEADGDDGTDTMCMVIDNRITSISDAISGFEIWNTQGNIIAINGSSPVGELPAT